MLRAYSITTLPERQLRLFIDQQFMTKLCIFCGSRVSSDEHVWPRWLMRLISHWPTRDMRMQATRLNKNGAMSTWDTNNPAIVVRNVCATKCNNGWMSDLEKLAAPVLTPLINGTKKSTIDRSQQAIIAAWTKKCAMIFDGMDGGGVFYDQSDRFYFREHLKPLSHSVVWLGCYRGDNLRGYTRHGTRSDINSSVPWKAHIFTMAFGHLVLQSLAIKFLKAHEKPTVYRIPIKGDWGTRTIELTQDQSDSMEMAWPPNLSFDDSEFSFDDFSDRFGKLL